MNTSIKILHWAPRIICILAILFISLFATDSFTPELTFWQQIGDFLMHLVPSFVLLGILIISLKWELNGGIIFTVISLVLSPFIFQHNFNMNHSVGMSLGIILVITFPFILVGILFIMSYSMKKRDLLKNHNG